ncbi:MAG TPA: hypothetical protein VK879_01535 [Candidatus Sulfomarinibacteraceae bacterium]|nr:hypothetical protein [Candidatus Sulfomarinibacteraceae bacterium]
MIVATSRKPPDVQAFGQDPRTEYRAYKITGYRVPAEGWLVRDGGFIVNIPAGTTLHGEYRGEDGITLPSDSFEDHGGGLAQGVFKMHTTEDGRQISNIRNVITFPGLGFEAQDLLP